jgi:hypothetical protein
VQSKKKSSSPFSFKASKMSFGMFFMEKAAFTTTGFDQ